MIESALLWYELYVSVLKELGFKLNPYYIFVANKTINGKQCTIAWYVDDNKVSHVEQEVIDDIIAKIEERFPGPTVTKGAEHTFNGIKMRFMKGKKDAINMRDYILEIIDDFGEETSTMVSSAAAKWLFTVNKNPKKLTGDKLDRFCLIVAKMLWVRFRG